MDFIVNDESVIATTAPGRDEVSRVLSSVGFTDEMQASAVASLSGGWKMKLALARAMLMKADILLLDEPTNHLDVTNVAWLENYLVSPISRVFSTAREDEGAQRERVRARKSTKTRQAKKRLTFFFPTFFFPSPPPPPPQKKKKNLQCSLTEVTSMIVSHDSGFLDNVCTHIIHYENRKLRRYKGNLSEFVKQVSSF